MQPQKLFTLFAIIVFSFDALCAETKTNSTPGSDGNTNSTPKIGFIISLPKAVFTNGEPIILWGVLTNRTDDAIKVPTASVGIGLELNVQDEHGKEITPKADVHGRHVSGIFSTSLAAHGCISNYVEINGLFDLTPGTYKVSAKRELSLLPPWGKDILISKTETFKLVTPPK
jgi:hypothetical protein